MVRYLGRRAALSLLTLYLFATAIFFLAQIVMPGDFTASLGPLPPGERRELQRQLGLDRPIWERYATWLGNLAHGDLGPAFGGPSGQAGVAGERIPVTTLLRSAVPLSLIAFTVAVGAAFAVGSWLGRVTAWRKGAWLRSITTTASVGFYTSFPPWLAFLAAYTLVALLGVGVYDRIRSVDFSRQVDVPFSLVGHRLTWFMWLTVVMSLVTLPAIHRAARVFNRQRLPLLISAAWVGIVPVAIWLTIGVAGQAFDLATAQLIPLVLFFVLFVGEVVILTQAAMVAGRREDYVLTARAKGLSDREVRDRHAARPALLPVLSRLVVSLPYFLAGMVIVEQALGYPGLGSVLFRALDVEDTFVIMGALLVIGLITMVARLVLDVLHAILDPRVRFGTAQETPGES
jgi:peptide/nickel transport system permease protein